MQVNAKDVLPFNTKISGVLRVCVRLLSDVQGSITYLERKQKKGKKASECSVCSIRALYQSECAARSLCFTVG